MRLELYHAMMNERIKKRAERLAQSAQGIYLPDEEFKSKFTPKEKRELIATWLKYFPNMSVINTKAVGRLAGPFYIGYDFITDNLAGAGLKPTLYTANICEFEVKEGFSINTCYSAKVVTYYWPLEVLEEYIDQEKSYIKIVADLDLDASLSLDDIFKYYQKLCAAAPLRDRAIAPALTAAWAGEIEKAKEYCDWAEEVTNARNYLEHNLSGMSQLTNREFYKHARELIYQPQKLRYNFIESVKALKLERVAYQDIVGTSYQEPYFKERDFEGNKCPEKESQRIEKYIFK